MYKCLLRAAVAVFVFLSALPGQAGPAAQTRLDILTEEITRAPDNQQLYLRRALVYSDSGMAAQALADVEQAESLGKPVDTAFVHGVLLYRAANYSAAKDQFDRYLAAYPNHTGALQYRARLLRNAGKGDAALADYEHLIALQPDLDPGTYLSAAALMAELPDRGTEDALALLDARIARVGPIPQLQRPAIALERQRGNYPGAMERLASLDEKTRATPEWHVEMAELLLLSGDPELARSHLQVAEEQLQTLRRTPARAELQIRLEQLARQATAPAPAE